MRQMTQVEVAWVAGIFEGEGTINIPRGDKYPQAKVSMTDKDIIERLQTVTGVGSVHLARKAPQEPHHKEQWLWSVTGRQNVYDFLTAISPFMGIRRLERIAEAMERLSREPKPTGPSPIFPCGTRAAANRHYNRGEKPCEPCRIALNEYQNRNKEGRK